MKLLVQPEDGTTPLVTAVRRARKSVDVMVFRFDRADLRRALADAVTRGVTMRTLIAHEQRGHAACASSSWTSWAPA